MEKFIYNGNAARILKACGAFGLSYNRLAALLRKGEVRVNGKKVYGDITVEKGDEIMIFAGASKPTAIYEDINILAAYKRKGIKSDGEDGFEGEIRRAGYADYKRSVKSDDDGFEGEIRKAGYADYKRSVKSDDDGFEGEIHRAGYADAVLCHRLDTNTDGIVLFAKNECAEKEIFRAFKEHKIEKKYLALVYGIFKDEGLKTAYLSKDEEEGTVFVSSEYFKGGETIETRFSRLEVFENQNLSLVDITLITGKTHQIRAHLKHLGYFVLGDGKYGDERINRRFRVSKQQLTAYGIRFFFGDESPLEYLNEKNIELKNPKSFLRIPNDGFFRE
jgi:23S rRNA-/tRNA-specific pseudouridylate synthase